MIERYKEVVDVLLVPRSLRGVGGWRSKKEQGKIQQQLSTNIARWMELGQPYPLPFQVEPLGIAAEELDTFLTSEEGREATLMLGRQKIRLVFDDRIGERTEYGRYHSVRYLGGEGLRESHEAYHGWLLKAKSEEVQPPKVSVLDSKMAILGACRQAMIREMDVVPALKRRLLSWDWDMLEEETREMRFYGYVVHE